MRAFIILGLLSFAQASFAGTEVKCSDSTYSVVVELGVNGGPYTVTKAGQTVATGVFNLVGEGYDEILTNAYITALQDSAGNVLGFGVQGVKDLRTPGQYAGKSDLFIDTSAGAFDGSTIDCQITVN